MKFETYVNRAKISSMNAIVGGQIVPTRTIQFMASVISVGGINWRLRLEAENVWPNCKKKQNVAYLS